MNNDYYDKYANSYGNPYYKDSYASYAALEKAAAAKWVLKKKLQSKVPEVEPEPVAVRHYRKQFLALGPNPSPCELCSKPMRVHPWADLGLAGDVVFCPFVSKKDA